MTPDREADEQARRLAVMVADCRDSPEQTAWHFINLYDHAEWQSSEIARLKVRIAELEPLKGAES